MALLAFTRVFTSDKVKMDIKVKLWYLHDDECVCVRNYNVDLQVCFDLSLPHASQVTLGNGQPFPLARAVGLMANPAQGELTNILLIIPKSHLFLISIDRLNDYYLLSVIVSIRPSGTLDAKFYDFEISKYNQTLIWYRCPVS